MFAEIIAAAADYEQSNRTHLAAMGASVRLCRRAELGHLRTGAVPWQTERQPRTFGDLYPIELRADTRPPSPPAAERTRMPLTAVADFCYVCW